MILNPTADFKAPSAWANEKHHPVGHRGPKGESVANPHKIRTLSRHLPANRIPFSPRTDFDEYASNTIPQL
jgi:hypothetical protein